MSASVVNLIGAVNITNMVQSPVIETPRLRLRGFRPDDETDQRFIIALVNDPAWVANIGKRDVSTCEQARAFLHNGRSPWSSAWVSAC